MTEKTRLDRLYDSGEKISKTIDNMETVIRRLIADHAVRVAKGFIEAGFKVYTCYMYSSQCWHEGGVPTVIVKGMSAEEAERWNDSPILNVKSYDELDEADITSLTLDNIDEIAQQEWR